MDKNKNSAEADKKELLQLLEWRRWQESPTDFIQDCCWTRDEADSGSVKRFPQKDYLSRIDELSQTEKILAVPKSRRMMMTWRSLAIIFWEGMFRKNQMIFVQSKKGGDSAYLLGDERLLFMYKHLPHHAHDFPKIVRKIKDNEGKGYSLVTFSNGTTFVAVAEGADQLRQYTASRVYCTEMAFWSQAELTWMALRPVIQGGGRILIDSSANPGFFQRLVEGNINNSNDETAPEVDAIDDITGVHEYRRNGAYIARIHYSADPDKCKQEWIDNEKEGATAAGWEREYEINFNVSLDKPYYNEFRYEAHVAKRILKPIESRPILRGWDYGLTPATLFGQTTAKGQILLLRELQSIDCGIRNHGKVVRSETATFYPNYDFSDVGDPAGNQRSQADEVTANEILYKEFNISVEPGAINMTERSEAVRWFLTNTTPDGQPMLLVDPRLSIIIGGFTGGYHRKTVAGKVLDEPEKNEFSHLMDCVSYLCAYVYKQRGAEDKNAAYQKAKAAGKIRRHGAM